MEFLRQFDRGERRALRHWSQAHSKRSRYLGSSLLGTTPSETHNFAAISVELDFDKFETDILCAALNSSLREEATGPV
eukprot:scaffold109128_cov19-Prasinocladus_malaysianus.AAC.2